MHEWTRALESIATAAKAVMDLRADPDWRAAFRAVQRNVSTVYLRSPSPRSFVIEDVVRVVARADGAIGRPPWLGVFELSGGRFLFVSVWCTRGLQENDYAGRGCIATSLEELMRWGIDHSERARFGDQLPVIDPA